MTTISENIKRINYELPQTVKLVAVSKTHPIEAIIDAYNCGQRVFGENKVQELCDKKSLLENYPDIKWHLIGHLQTNKVKFITSFVEMIHSVDSLKLLKEIDKHAQKDGRVIKCLFEMYIASEETKFGLEKSELIEILNSDDFKSLKNISICGLMGMASNTDDTLKIESEMKNLKSIFDQIKTDYFSNDTNFKEISMGMSHDWRIAMKSGSTMVRIGSTIFGSRSYNK